MQEGQKIRDYILEEKIGEGGMGEVWRAEHLILHRPVAIKAMARHVESDPEFGRRFLQEARSQARLSHPRIVHVSDFFAEDGQYFLVMPLLSGKTLADRLHEVKGPLSTGEALALARDVLDALDYAHQQGVIHRDVKPSNILLDPGDQEAHASLTDFGIALSLGRQRVTQDTASLGTPHYMSPEQIRSPRTIDHRTDVYSFGCVLYEMLTGLPPFADAVGSDDTDFALKEAHVYRVPESLRTRNPQIPAWLDAAVLRALAKNPDERFSGCGELRRTLDAGPAAAPSASSPVLVPATTGRAVRRPGSPPLEGRRLPVVLIALLVIVVAGLALFATRDRSDSPEATAGELTTDLSAEPAAAPLGAKVEVLEAGTTRSRSAEPRPPDTLEPVATDLETAESVPVEIGTEPLEEEPVTTEPVATDLEINGGVNPPADTDLETAEPLGTDLAPPP